MPRNIMPLVRRITLNYPIRCVLFFLIYFYHAPIPAWSENFQKKIIVAIPQDWPPYCRFDADTSAPDGFAIDVFNEIAKRLDLNIEYKAYASWPDIHNAVQSGSADLVPHMGISDEQVHLYDFTVPLETLDIHIFVRNATREIQTATDLKNRKTAVVAFSRASIIMKSLGHPNLVMFNSIEEAIIGLISGHVDALVHPEPTVWMLARQAGLDQRIKTVGASLLEIKRGVGVSKGHPKLVSDINRTISQFMGDPNYQRIYEKWFTAPTPFWHLKHPLIVIGLLLSVTAGILLFWRYMSIFSANRQLRESIEQSKNTEKALREREESFRQLTENIKEVFWIGSPDWRKVYYISPTYEDIWGISCESLYENPLSWLESIVESDRKKVLAVVPKDPKKMKELIFPEYRIRKPDGSLKWILARAYPISNEKGEIYRIAGIAEDITERKTADESLRFQSLLLDKIQDLITATDLDGNILYVNEAEMKAAKRQPEELMGESVDVFGENPSKGATQQEIIDNTLKNGTWRGDVVNYDSDGREILLDCRTTLINDHNGNPWRLVGIATDITQRRQMELKLQQAQKMESIGNLAGGIAHDFNNVLYPILGRSEMLMDDLPKGSPEHESACEIFIAGQRGANLVKQILSFSRKQDQKKIPVRMEEILYEALKLTRSTLPANVSILDDILPDCGYVMADFTQLHQVVTNLITNASHAVEKNNGTIMVKLRKKVINDGQVNGTDLVSGPYFHLSVTDNGAGMAPDVVKNIFEPYFTTKERGKGTGLGLAVAFGIVKEHDGAIRVQSRLGEGSTFHIYFPLIEKASEIPLVQTERTVETGFERILMVDDEEPIATLQAQILSRLGYQVTAKTDSAVALDTFQQNPNQFDLVITDMTMPKMTGDILSKQILSIRPEMPIIICTGYSERLSPEQAQSLGIKGFLMKPVVKSDLARLIRKILDQD